MKKLLCSLLVLVLLTLSAVPAFANDDNTFDTTFTNAANNSLSGWYSTGYNRALLTVLISIDYVLAGYDSDKLDLSWDTFVGVTYNDTFNALVVAIPWKNTGYTIFLYTPDIGIGSFFDMEDAIPSLMELTLASTIDKYEKNSILDISKAADDLSEIFT